MSDTLDYRIHPDADGWVNSVTATEGIEDRPGVQVSPELGEALIKAEAIVAHYDGVCLCVPHDDRRLWRVLRASGSFGEEALHRCRLLRPLQAACPDVAPGVGAPAALPCGPLDTPEYVFPDVPGLKLRALCHDDLDAMTALAVETGIYSAVCPEARSCCQPPEAHPWMQLAARLDHENTWQMTLEFNGRPLQCELIFLDPLHPTITLTMHFTRERPHWFWREAERPVFEALLVRGHRTVWTRTRKDRPDWIAALKRNYGATEVAHIELQRQKVLEFPLDLSLFKGWPARRTLSGWSWEHLGAGVTMRETTSDEVPVLLRDLAHTWGDDHPTLSGIRRTLGDRWALDRASILAARRGARLVGAFAIYPRVGVTGHMGTFHRDGDPTMDSVARVVYRGACEWALQAGYSTLTGMVPAPTWDSPIERRLLQHTRATIVTKHTKFRTPMVEISRDLATIVAEPLSRWEAWTPQPELPRIEELP